MFWKQPFEYYDSPDMQNVRGILEVYLNDLRRIRYSLLSANYSWSPPDPDWTLVNGYDQDYFISVKSHAQVHSLFLTANFSLLYSLLPVKEYFDYGGNRYTCHIMTTKERAIYADGDTLLNKSCLTEKRRILVPKQIDKTMLSLGLPFKLNQTVSAPNGHSSNEIILTFVNVIQNGVVTSHGEVFSGKLGIMSQRCSHPWYRAKVPENLDDLPIYDEVLTITQQTIAWYYHNTIEDLPKIAPYLGFLKENPHIKIHITRAEFHEKMLEYIGISKDRLVWGPLRGRIVYLPAGTTCGRPPVFNAQILAAIFRQRMRTKIGPVKQDTIIVIRRSSPNRQFRYHDAIVDMLKKDVIPRGYKIAVFRDDPSPSLASYIELFQRAKIIIAPHGAGLSNALFAQKKTLILEGLCEMEPRIWFCFYGYLPWLCYKQFSRVSLSFRNMATILGQYYVGMAISDGCLYISPNYIHTEMQFFLK